MQHTINCVQNAIKCAYENNAHATKTTTREYYEIANMYIDESIITCACHYERISMIENELRELYRFAHINNFNVKSNHVQNDLYHVAYSITYDDNSTQFVTMIVRYNDEKSSFKSFDNFDLLNEIEIY